MTQYKITFFLCLLLWINLAFSQITPPPTTNPCIGPQGQIEWKYWNNIQEFRVNDLHTNHRFPLSPTGSIDITTPDYPPDIRFNDYYGSLIKGYLTVPVTGKYTFNVMADESANFYLSSDDNPSNRTLEVAEVWRTGFTGFYNRVGSHTDTFQLVENTYYYFELHHKEKATNADYIRLFWNTPEMADSTWQIIPSSHVYKNLCEIVCPIIGTPCDDGDTSTTNDREDGACNCIGDSPSTSACVGRQGILREMVWTEGMGSSTNFNDLYDNPNYPNSPDTVIFESPYQQLSKNNEFRVNFYGSVVKAYIKVPISGNYQFNLTADDQAKLFLSTDEDPANKEELCDNQDINNFYEHDEFPEQTSSIISLVAGKYYYLELHYRQRAGNARYYVFWKTPFYPDTNWRVIPTVYLYEYNCETACLPNGTPCDDGDATTYPDTITDCNCAGPPCPDGDCTGLETYIPYDECGYQEAHTSKPSNSWLACSTTQSPNPARGNSHWIHYDFDKPYVLNSSMFYNYNVGGATGSGFKDFAIDYSMDGAHWSELGVYELPQASGTNDYAGVVGPNLDGIVAKHLLITALSIWDNGTCAGLSEVMFEGQVCPDDGTDCACASFAKQDRVISSFGSTVISGRYKVNGELSSAGIVETGSNVDFRAGQSILLQPGFHVESGSDFHALIEACDVTNAIKTTNESIVQQNQMIINSETAKIEKIEKHTIGFSPFEKNIEDLDFKVSPNPFSGQTKLQFSLSQVDVVSINIFDQSGRLVDRLLNPQSRTAGVYEVYLTDEKLYEGLFFVVLQTSKKHVVRKVVMLKNGSWDRDDD